MGLAPAAAWNHPSWSISAEWFAYLSFPAFAWLAWRLAKKTGRTDVCALPSGISVPHLFIVTFVIMLPVKLATGDPMKGWQAGLTWVFIQSFVLMLGGFLAPIVYQGRWHNNQRGPVKAPGLFLC